MIRVALGTVYPYDEARVRGGVEAVAATLVKAVAELPEIDLHVVSCTAAISEPITELRGRVAFHWLPKGRGPSTARQLTVDRQRVALAYRAIAPQIVHAQGFSEYALATPPGVPMLLTVHGLEYFAPSMSKAPRFQGVAGWYRRWASRQIIRESVRRAEAIVSIAGDYVPQVMDGTLRGKPVYTIANPIDMSVWSCVPTNAERMGRILCVGTVAEHKNNLGLVQAFARVLERFPRAELHFAGGIADRGYFQRVQALIRTQGLESNVQFSGHLAIDALRREYAEAAILVLPSIQETAPMAVAQAMAAGKTVVATSVGGTPWMIEDGVSGILVEPGDTAALARALIRVLDDPGLRLAIGRAGQERAADRFAAAKVAEQTLSAYRDLISRGVS